MKVSPADLPVSFGGCVVVVLCVFSAFNNKIAEVQIIFLDYSRPSAPSCSATLNWSKKSGMQSFILKKLTVPV
jgi:hypothetical protein